jgi:hypothetical protein
MATTNGLTYSVSLASTVPTAILSTGTLSDTVDVSGSYGASETQAIGTSNEALSFNTTDITGDVHLVVKNNDSTNYVEIFKDSGNTHLLSKLNAGESCSLRRVPSASLYARANTAAVSIQFWILQA